MITVQIDLHFWRMCKRGIGWEVLIGIDGIVHPRCMQDNLALFSLL